MLKNWSGPRIFYEGKNLFHNGYVEWVEYTHPIISGSLKRGDRSIASQFELLPDGSVSNQCPCRDNRDRGIICTHVIALALTLIRRHTDPERHRKAHEEIRRTKRIAEMDETQYLERVPQNTPGATPATLHLVLTENWNKDLCAGYVHIHAKAKYNNQTEYLDKIPCDIPLSFTPQDEAILFVLEDISEGPTKGALSVKHADFINLLNLHVGKHIYDQNHGIPITVNTSKMSSILRIDLDHKTGELILNIHTELPFMDPHTTPLYLLSGKTGWLYHANHFWPLASLLPTPLHTIYEKPITVERPSIPRFMSTEFPLLEQYISIETELSIDLFTIEPATPLFRLVVQGSPASLSGTLYAQYGDTMLTAGKAEAAGDFSCPDPDDFFRYTVRNLEKEKQGLKQLAPIGFAGEKGDALEPIIGCRDVLNVLGSGFPQLRRKGWKVELTGLIETHMDTLDFATPIVHVNDSTTAGWFEVGFDYENGQGQSLSENEIQRALLKGESYIEKNGRTVLLDADAINTAKDVFQDCSSGEGTHPGTFKLNEIYSAYVKTSLDALDGIDVETTPSWQSKATQQNRTQAIEPIELLPTLENTLRIYQKEGVYWLRFLENNMFGGILADEMGLGKTVQTLAWIQTQRTHPHAKGKPILIVGPSSLVDNWAEEAARFVPDLNVLTLSGSDRHAKWDQIKNIDIAITSYALIRRDIEQYLEYEFAAVILDEAQHIKNRSTQNAMAAKRLKSHHRFVLTGTPIENSVSDLWSIMDFLMPGYLASHNVFRLNYETPIEQGGPEGEQAQAKLRRKLHPFMLRRLKKDVAKDLPDKIERVASCSLTGDQQNVYTEMLHASQRRINDMVSKQGFQKSRMEILKTLLRLRQICCHLDLLKLPNLKSEYPSGKMDLFFELLNEAMDGGHRILVFSQFTSMLRIIRTQLETKNLRYCYLDGATQKRLRVVRTFNTDKEIPLFLISLKAGGSGLNLTGADMVIHFDPWWNPAVENQATDRAHRIGQTQTVYSIKLITKGTVEEKVLAMQKKKQRVINATLSDDDQVTSKLTWDDVQELLTL